MLDSEFRRLKMTLIKYATMKMTLTKNATIKMTVVIINVQNRNF